MKYISLLLFSFIINVTIVGQCPDPLHPDYQAMVDLYNSTNGPGWTNKTGWEAGAAGTNCDPCSGWYGVLCNNGRVGGIDLDGFVNFTGNESGGGNNLSGVISSIELDELVFLSLQDNNLSGNVSNLLSSNIRALLLKNNNFSLINDINFNDDLNLLDIRLNNFNQPLPLITAPNLLEFDFSNNSFHGCIPQSYETLCNNSVDGDFSNNPLLDTQSWGNFCSSGEGACSISNNNCPITASFDYNLAQCNNEDISFNITMNDGVPPFYINLTAKNVISGQNFVLVGEFNGQLGLNTFTLPVGAPYYLPDGEYDFILTASNSNGSDVIYQCTPGLVGVSTDNMVVGPCSNTNCPSSGELFVQSFLCNNEDFNLGLFINDGIAPFHFDITAKNTITGQDYPLVFDFNGQGGNNNFSIQSGSSTYLPDGNYQVTAVVNSSNGSDVIYQCAPSLELTKEIDVKSCTNPCSHPDYIELMKLYNSTGGPNWTNNNGWKEGAAGTNCDPCGWYGIKCDSSRVIKIELDGKVNDTLDLITGGNNLDGELPNLSFEKLQVLNLAKNSISGPIPNLTIPKIKKIHIPNNQLTGSIPKFNQQSLEEIYLQYNNLSSTIPEFSLPNLKVLDIGGNPLKGSIPNNLFLPKLEFLSLGASNIEGTIPTLDFPKLRYIWLHETQLRGSIPLLDFPELEGFNLYNNKFSGQIPSLKFPKLTSFNVNTNELIGSIPPLDFPNLRYLDLSKNMLEGCIPSSFKQNCGNLSYSDISGNLFLGNPSWDAFCNNNIGKCNDTLLCTHPDYADLIKLYNSTGGPNWINNNGWKEGAAGTNCDPCGWYGIKCNSNNRVTCLDLDGINNCEWDFNSGNNNMTGSIPDISFSEIEFFNLSNNGLVGKLTSLTLPKVRSLNVTNSKLTGSLTDFNLNLPSLEEIRLQYNQFSGSIPNFNSQNLKIIDIGGNNLTGSLPYLTTPNLQYLSFGTNSLTGSIPAYNLPLLQTFYLHNNQFTGSLPEFTFPNIKIIRIENNNLSGCIPVQYLNICSSNIEVNIANNPDLSTDSWADFCNDNEGICCFKPTVQNINDLIKVNEQNEIYLIPFGIYPARYKLNITNIKNNNLTKVEIDSNGLLKVEYDKHFFGAIEITIEACGLDCNKCDTFVCYLKDEYLPDITPTNVITPDGDGRNDMLRFNSKSLIFDSELHIYNRWGDQIYHKKDYTNDWAADGYPGGVYFYLLKVKDIVLKSTLTIIK